MPAEACWGSSMDAVDGIEFSLEGANSMRPWRWCDGVDGACQVSLVNLKPCLREWGVARWADETYRDGPTRGAWRWPVAHRPSTAWRKPLAGGAGRSARGNARVLGNQLDHVLSARWRATSARSRH